jgi:hypothetical protein
MVRNLGVELQTLITIIIDEEFVNPYKKMREILAEGKNQEATKREREERQQHQEISRRITSSLSSPSPFHN